ncbi:MAG: N-acetylglucosamine-6-phosphate deacetylase, partial [Anaerolinea sp.]|nr:N-acetylglucosamine-6-phosphate deacetylase [Anaerolinea sp.]
MKICNALLLTTNRELRKGSLSINNGVITNVYHAEGQIESGDIDANGWIASPGWIDIQINGGFGIDLTTNPELLWEVAAQLPKFGITGFLPTIITSAPETYEKAISIYKKGPPSGWRGARPFGWHFEGPFLNPSKKGAHNSSCLRQPDVSFVKNWTRENGVMLVTMAPELSSAESTAVKLISNNVILSMGHSMATVAETQRAVEVGYTSATHLFNAMPALDHRAPGLAGEVLVNNKITAGLIADGQHVHPNMVKAAWQLKMPGELAMVSDAVGALGMPPGVYQQGGMEITVTENSAKLKDGTLAGSVLRLDQALRNVMAYTGSSIEQVLPALAENQARLLKLEKLGCILPGYNADLTF